MLKEVQDRPLSDVKELKAVDIFRRVEQDRLRATGWIQLFIEDGRPLVDHNKYLFIHF